ncbi:MAG: hypothetical protein IKU38_04890, partial [Clostridia bacterium]|nr:hypothetical protein [Clostridia bacterium]
AGDEVHVGRNLLIHVIPSSFEYIKAALSHWDEAARGTTQISAGMLPDPLPTQSAKIPFHADEAGSQHRICWHPLH